MAGLLGIVGEGSLGELRAMALRMAYRGRYLSTSNPAPGVYLGELHRRPGHRQSSSTLFLDTNGPLYPRDPFTTASPADAEEREQRRLELDLQRRGISALRDVSGHFALVFWDAATNTVSLACDRQKFKTLYYVGLHGRIAFATDYKALLALPDCPAEVDRDVLQTYLGLLSCPDGRSLLKNVIPLTRATVLKVQGGRCSVERFWSPHRRHPERSFRDAAQSLRTTLETSVARQLAGHGRAGLMLGGGLDSTALLALVRHVRPDLEVATYTIGHGATDPEIVGARATAAHFRTEHREHFFSVKELSIELPKLVWLTEDLSGREEALLQRVITVLASARDRVILAGHGADMVFGGMPRHRILWLHDRAPPPLRGALSELYVYARYKSMPRSWLGRRLVARAYRGDLPEPPPVIGANAVIVSEAYESLDRYMEEHNTSAASFYYHEPLHAQLDTTLLIPFLDPEVTEFALGCPGNYHIGLRAQKRLLRAAVQDLLPGFVLSRRKAIQRLKHGIELSDAIDSIADELDLAQALASRDLISMEYVKTLRVRPSGSAISRERLHILWALISAELWMRQFIDARGKPIVSFDVGLTEVQAQGVG